MSRNADKSDSLTRGEGQRTAIRKSYDEIPQPKGKFRNLFQEMRDRSAENSKRSAKNDDSAR